MARVRAPCPLVFRLQLHTIWRSWKIGWRLPRLSIWRSGVSQLIILNYLKRDFSFWNHFIPSLVNYMTTTFPPSEVSVRRELVTFKILVAVLVLFLMLILVLCLSFGYCLYDKDKGDGTIDRRTLVTRQSDYPTSQNVSMQRISSL